MRKVVVLFMTALMSWPLFAQVLQPTIKVGLMLPLQADALKCDRNMDRFADFYTGALLAVYEVQQTGQKVEVHTYDVGRTAHGLQHLLDTSSLKQMDMIIGPAYLQQVHVVADWAKEHGVRVLLPFSSDVPELATNPCLMQFNPSSQMEAVQIVDYLYNRPKPVRCVWVESGGAEVPVSVQQMQQCMMDQGMDVVYTTLSAILNDSLSYSLSNEKENVILLNTERYANVRSLMPYLERASQTDSLTIISRYSWQTETIAIPQIYSTVFKAIDETTTAAYDSLYHHFIPQPTHPSHPHFDLLGYDIMYYVLSSVQTDSIERPYIGVQSDIHFQRISDEGGYSNTQIKVVRKE